MNKEELKPIDVSKYKITETGQVLKTTKEETTEAGMHKDNTHSYKFCNMLNVRDLKEDIEDLPDDYVLVLPNGKLVGCLETKCDHNKRTICIIFKKD